MSTPFLGGVCGDECTNGLLAMGYRLQEKLGDDKTHNKRDHNCLAHCVSWGSERN